MRISIEQQHWNSCYLISGAIENPKVIQKNLEFIVQSTLKSHAFDCRYCLDDELYNRQCLTFYSYLSIKTDFMSVVAGIIYWVFEISKLKFSEETFICFT